MIDLTAKVLDEIDSHLKEHGTFPPMMSPDELERHRAREQETIDELAQKVQFIVTDDRQPFPEEQELLEHIKSQESSHWLDTSFWGAYLMVWDARLKHYQNNWDAYKEKGIVICRTTQIVSYHTCEVSEVAVSDMQDNILWVSELLHAVYNPSDKGDWILGKSAWHVACEEMQKQGYTHFLHRGALPVNTGATPHGWMDKKSVKKRLAECEKRRKDAYERD